MFDRLLDSAKCADSTAPSGCAKRRRFFSVGGFLLMLISGFTVGQESVLVSCTVVRVSSRLAVP